MRLDMLPCAQADRHTYYLCSVFFVLVPLLLFGLTKQMMTAIRIVIACTMLTHQTEKMFVNFSGLVVFGVQHFSENLLNAWNVSMCLNVFNVKRSDRTHRNHKNVAYADRTTNNMYTRSCIILVHAYEWKRGGPQ